MAVFLPSRFSATALQRFSVSFASSRMRVSVATSSLSPLAREATLRVATWAACARPSTSASLLSSCVSCAMLARLPVLAAAEARAGLHARGARVVAGRGLLAVAGPDDLHGDRAALRRDEQPVAVDL